MIINTSFFNYENFEPINEGFVSQFEGMFIHIHTTKHHKGVPTNFSSWRSFIKFPEPCSLSFISKRIKMDNISSNSAKK